MCVWQQSTTIRVRGRASNSCVQTAPREFDRGGDGFVCRVLIPVHIIASRPNEFARQVSTATIGMVRTDGFVRLFQRRRIYDEVPFLKTTNDQRQRNDDGFVRQIFWGSLRAPWHPELPRVSCTLNRVPRSSMREVKASRAAVLLQTAHTSYLIIYEN